MGRGGSDIKMRFDFWRRKTERIIKEKRISFDKLEGHINEQLDAETGKIRKDAPPAQLYNLKTDLQQTTNLFNDHPEIVIEMKALLESYRKEIGPFPELGWIDRR